MKEMKIKKGQKFQIKNSVWFGNMVVKVVRLCTGEFSHAASVVEIGGTDRGQFLIHKSFLTTLK